MKKTYYLLIVIFAVSLFGYSCKDKDKKTVEKAVMTESNNPEFAYTLPSPTLEGKISVEQALYKRRSHRNFTEDQISSEDISQILWAAYGVTQPMSGYPFMRGGLRTAPSAGALYPLEIYVLIGNVKDIEPGVYRYISQEHKIIRVIDKDLRSELCSAALGQEMIKTAPAVLFYSAIFERNMQKYGDRGHERYVCMDLGHSAENVYLQAEALHLGTCAIGAFKDSEVRRVMQLPGEEEPLYIMPIGRYFLKEEF